jgi:2-oxoisovalerate dehydrogenase E1 component alpha subunit
VATWQNQDSPISRFRKYLELKDWWTQEEDVAFRKATRANVLKAFMEAEKLPKPSVSEMFTDVYDEIPDHLKKQKLELERIMKEYPEFYDTSAYKV